MERGNSFALLGQAAGMARAATKRLREGAGKAQGRRRESAGKVQNMRDAASRALKLGLMGCLLCVWLPATSSAGDATPSAAGSAATLASFTAFVDTWIEQLAEDAQNERELKRMTLQASAGNSGFSYREIPAGYEVRIKETGRANTPYVGVLRYVEERFKCRRRPVEVCERTEATQMTEIFPFKNGAWQY